MSLSVPSQSFKLYSPWVHQKEQMCKAILLLTFARVLPVRTMQTSRPSLGGQCRTAHSLPLKEVDLYQRQHPEEAPPGVKDQLPVLGLSLRQPWSVAPLSLLLRHLVSQGTTSTSSGTSPWRVLFLLFSHLYLPWMKPTMSPTEGLLADQPRPCSLSVIPCSLGLCPLFLILSFLLKLSNCH